MMSDTNSARSRPQDAEVATEALRTEAHVVRADRTVVPVGTFAAGQSEDGRHVAATTAPQGSFAEGQEDEVAPEKPSPHARTRPTPDHRSAFFHRP